MVHFPIALWIASTLMIALRVLFPGALGQAMDRALPVFLGLGTLLGLVAWSLGFMVWEWETISSTPMGRNHMLTASWTWSYFAVLTWLRIVYGQAIWQGLSRWVMLVLAGIGVVLAGVTGTLGGHLIGVYTDLGRVLEALGWNVYTTFFVPNSTLYVLAAVIVVLVLVGVFRLRKGNPD